MCCAWKHRVFYHLYDEPFCLDQLCMKNVLGSKQASSVASNFTCTATVYHCVVFLSLQLSAHQLVWIRQNHIWSHPYMSHPCVFQVTPYTGVTLLETMVSRFRIQWCQAFEYNGVKPLDIKACPACCADVKQLMTIRT